MSNCEKQVKELCDKLGFHSVMTGLINWVEIKSEYCNEKIYTAEDEQLASILKTLKKAHSNYVARFTCNA